MRKFPTVLIIINILDCGIYRKKPIQKQKDALKKFLKNRKNESQVDVKIYLKKESEYISCGLKFLTLQEG